MSVNVGENKSFRFTAAEEKSAIDGMVRKVVGIEGRPISSSSIPLAHSKKPLAFLRLWNQRINDFATTKQLFVRARVESERAFGQAGLASLIHSQVGLKDTISGNELEVIEGHLHLNTVHAKDIALTGNADSNPVLGTNSPWKAFANSTQAKELMHHADFMYTHPDQFTGVTKGLIKASRMLRQLGDLYLLRYVGTAKALRSATEGNQARPTRFRGPIMYAAVVLTDMLARVTIGQVPQLGRVIMPVTWGMSALLIKAAGKYDALRNAGKLTESQKNFVASFALLSAREQLSTAAKERNFLSAQEGEDRAASQAIALSHVDRKVGDYEALRPNRLRPRAFANGPLTGRTLPGEIQKAAAYAILEVNNAPEAGTDKTLPTTDKTVLKSLIETYQDGIADGKEVVNKGKGAGESRDQTHREQLKVAKYTMLGLGHALSLVGGSKNMAILSSASDSVGTGLKSVVGIDTSPLALIKNAQKYDTHVSETIGKHLFKARTQVLDRSAYCLAKGITFGGDLSKSAYAKKVINGMEIDEFTGTRKWLQMAARRLTLGIGQTIGGEVGSGLKKVSDKDTNPNRVHERAGTFYHARTNAHQYGFMSRNLAQLIAKIEHFSEITAQYALGETGRLIGHTASHYASNKSSRIVWNTFGFAAAATVLSEIALAAGPLGVVPLAKTAVALTGPALGAAAAFLLLPPLYLALTVTSKFDWKGDIQAPVGPKFPSLIDARPTAALRPAY